MIILASASPRRRQLLTMLSIPHAADAPEVDEIVLPGESPTGAAVRLALLKAHTVAARHPGDHVLGSDTIVVIDDEMLGKPGSDAEAREMLRRLSGRTHEVVSAVALVSPARAGTRVDVTRVTFRDLSEEMIADYVATGEPRDKAGAYGIQGYGAALVARIEGDFFGVMGLPVRLVLELLEEAGLPYRFTR